jgi:hypothetical protein
MAPDNPSLPCLLNEATHQGSVAKTKQQILDSSAFFRSIEAVQSALRIRFMRRECPHQLLVINDQRAVVVPYLHSNSTFRSPLFDFSKESDFYEVFTIEFDSLWEKATRGGTEDDTESGPRD